MNSNFAHASFPHRALGRVEEIRVLNCYINEINILNSIFARMRPLTMFEEWNSYLLYK